MTWHDWVRLLAPEPPRRLSHERAMNVACRTAHLIGLVLFVGGWVWGVPFQRLASAWWLTVASGLALTALELGKSFHWLFLGKGLAVLGKLALVAASRWVPQPVGTALLLSAVAAASIGAHMPSRYRHYSVLLGRPLLPAEPNAPDVAAPPDRVHMPSGARAPAWPQSTKPGRVRFAWVLGLRRRLPRG
jgi:hypothetical protein